MNRSRIAVLLGLTAVVGCSQPNASPPPQPPKVTTTLSGRVFVITVGGDLKPARMARVYILSGDSLANEEAISGAAESARLHCESAHRLREAVDTGNDSSGFMAKDLRMELSAYRDALARVEKFVAADVGTKNALAISADEDGRFSVSSLSSGSYRVVVFGQAGVNLGYWRERLRVNVGDHIELKMSEPDLACPIF